MEEQEKLEKGIGTKELETLKPKTVKILHVAIVAVGEGTNLNEKVVCTVKHPDKEETINISAVKTIKGKNVKTSGLWFKEDEDGLIQKGTSLTIFLEFLGIKKPIELEGKDVPTVLDDKGYLCFKAY